MAKAKDLHTDLGLKEEDLIEMFRYMLRGHAMNASGR